jgi:hypothetical protein
MMSISAPSVQSLLLELRFCTATLSTGTGFVVESKKGPMLITNWHNVTGRHIATREPLSPTGGIPNTVCVMHNKANHLGAWIRKTEPLLSDGKPRWIEHPQLGDKVDVVALPLTDLDDVQLFPYALNSEPSILVNPADPVSVVGFPFGLTGGGSLALWATGFMASEPDVNYSDLPLFLIDCRARPGQSGSAVIAQRNGGAVATADGGTTMFSGSITKLLGVYSGRINEQSDLGLVWKSCAIADILESL